MIDLSKIRLIGFDCDGTLVTTQSGNTFRKNAADWKILPGRVAKLAELRDEGKHLFIATNQGGVAFGYLREDEIAQELHRLAIAFLISANHVYICYSHPDPKALEQYRRQDDRRKPGHGMLSEAIMDFECTPEETLFIGDRDEDELAAKNAGCSFEWAWQFFGEDGPNR